MLQQYLVHKPERMVKCCHQQQKGIFVIIECTVTFKTQPWKGKTLEKAAE